MINITNEQELKEVLIDFCKNNRGITIPIYDRNIEIGVDNYLKSIKE